MEAKAHVKYLRMSPRKVKIVCDMIRGKDVATATAYIMQTPKAACEPVLKVLKSAIANAENNRLQIFFDEIPSPELRQELKGRGFRWARSEGAWQRQLTDNAIYFASRIQAIQPSDGSDPLKLQPKHKPKTGLTR